MSIHKYIAVAVTAIFINAVAAQAQQAFVIDRSGNQIKGTEVKADQQGDLRIIVGGGASRTFRRGTYRTVYTPKPRDIAMLEEAYDRERYDVIAERGPGILNDTKYLGWGGRASYLLGQAYLEQDDAEKALRTFEQGAPFAGMQRNAEQQMAELNKGKVAALMMLDRNDEAQQILKELKGSGGDDIAAFAFNASARLLKAQGNKRDAVLEYLKTMLLFTPDQVPHERKKAKDELVALLRDMNDPRFQTIEKMK